MPGVKSSFSRRSLLKSAAVLAAARQLACADPEPRSGERAALGGGGESLPKGGYDAFACATTPTAYIAPGASTERARALRAQLEAAGFEVEQLGLEQSPRQLRGLLVTR
jgi:hypothetical protein